MDKQTLRTHMRTLRQQLSPEQQQHCADAVLQHLIQSPLLHSCEHIACYYPNEGELNTLAIMQTLSQQNKHLYLPIIDADKNLHFYLYTPGDALKNNKYNIPQPIAIPAHHIAKTQLDAVLVPLVAFDEQGHRLGMGGGYYDKNFKNSTVPLIGLAYEFQKTDKLVTDPWDVTLSAIVTERRIYP